MRSITLEPVNVETQVSLESEPTTSMVKPDMVLTDKDVYTDNNTQIITGGIKPIPIGSLEPVMDAGSSIINTMINAELIGGERPEKKPIVTDSGSVIVVDTTNGSVPSAGGGIGGGGRVGMRDSGDEEVVEAPMKPKKFPFLLVGAAVIVGYLIFRKR
jgi:hypothetical protein